MFYFVGECLGDCFDKSDLCYDLVIFGWCGFESEYVVVLFGEVGGNFGEGVVEYCWYWLCFGFEVGVYFVVYLFVVFGFLGFFFGVVLYVFGY